MRVAFIKWHTDELGLPDIDWDRNVYDMHFMIILVEIQRTESGRLRAI